ncbi:hypothetical protein WMY93_000026 [Mugilogobius chulae]|uniref:Uncharacterized protein n=1 Tax=Mugilogobius chulae TaxID=88201 RepID=A0AAW0Q6F6_9GOBI
MVQGRLLQRPQQSEAEVLSAEEEPQTDPEPASESEDITLEVCRAAAQMRQDLLYIHRTVCPCYPPDMTVLDTYLQLYHRCFSSLLEQLASGPLDNSALYCLLKWANHRYPRDIVDPELEGKVDTDTLDRYCQRPGADASGAVSDQHRSITQECDEGQLRSTGVVGESVSRGISSVLTAPALCDNSDHVPVWWLCSLSHLLYVSI